MSKTSSEFEEGLIIDNESYIDSDSIGLQSLLGTEGLPTNRVFLAIGQPYNGKSTFFFRHIADYDKRGYEVDFLETENGLDKHYASSFYGHRTIERKDALIWYLRMLQIRTNKLDERTAAAKKKNPLDIEMIEEVLADLNKEKEIKAASSEKSEAYQKMHVYMMTCAHVAHLIGMMESGEYPYAANRTVLDDEGMTIQMAEKLIRDAIAEYRLQNVNFKTDIRSFEKMEEYLNEVFEERIKDKRLAAKPKLVIVDSLNGLFPENDLEKEHSNDGNAFGTARYLHSWIPKIYRKLKQANISIGFTCQLTTKIKMNIFEKSDEIADAVFRGGSALKFAATAIFLIERDKRVPARLDTRNGQTCVGAGKIRLIKAKQQGGGTSMSNIVAFQLVRDENNNNSVDFDEPFFDSWMKEAGTTDPKCGVFQAGAYTICLAKAARTSDAWNEAYESKVKPLEDLKSVPEGISNLFDPNELFVSEYTKNMLPVVNNRMTRQAIRDRLGISMNVAKRKVVYVMPKEVIEEEDTEAVAS